MQLSQSQMARLRYSWESAQHGAELEQERTMRKQLASMLHILGIFLIGFGTGLVLLATIMQYYG